MMQEVMGDAMDDVMEAMIPEEKEGGPVVGQVLER
jgi:hypothetical protein